MKVSAAASLLHSTRWLTQCFLRCSVQYLRPPLRRAKESWNWWWKQDVSTSSSQADKEIAFGYVCGSWPVLVLCTAAPSLTGEWARKSMAPWWAMITRVTSSRSQVEMTNRVSRWSKVSWKTAESASSLRKVSDTSPQRMARSSFLIHSFCSI